MKNKFRRAGAHLKRVYTEPWTVRSAKINTVVWAAGTAVGVANFAMGVFGSSSWVWLVTVVNIALVCFDLTMLKWSVSGLLWRKAQDDLARDEALITEAFYAMVINEYKRP